MIMTKKTQSISITITFDDNDKKLYGKKSSFQETQSLFGNKRTGLYQLAWDLSGEDDDDDDDFDDNDDDDECDSMTMTKSNYE